MLFNSFMIRSLIIELVDRLDVFTACSSSHYS